MRGRDSSPPAPKAAPIQAMNRATWKITLNINPYLAKDCAYQFGPFQNPAVYDAFIDALQITGLFVLASPSFSPANSRYVFLRHPFKKNKCDGE